MNVHTPIKNGEIYVSEVIPLARCHGAFVAKVRRTPGGEDLPPARILPAKTPPTSS